MLNKLPRRKRHMAVAVALSVVFVLTTAAFLWLQSAPAPDYRPGEAVEGLTARLDRSLPDDYPHVRFVDATREAGIAFRHFAGTRSSQLPEDMGSGAAWGDYDNDGWLDLFVVNSAGPLTLTPEEMATSPAHHRLYHNNGDGTFTEVSAQAGVDARGWGMAAAWGDYDNDGWLDLFVTSYGQNIFFRNEGDGTFTDATRAAGLGLEEGFWAGASWGDYNRDGWLDLYVTGYVQYVPQDDRRASLQYDVETPASINPSSFAPERNLLYRNNGDGTFAEVAQRSGVANPEGRSLSAAWLDLDEDGWLDLYVANDVSDNVFYRNLGNETFADISHPARVADYRGAMGIAAGDWDGDTDQDLFLTHWIAQENALYDNRLVDAAAPAGASPKPLQFMDVADRFGLGQIALDYIGWGTSFFDYDNDGRLDLFVANGSTFQQKEAPHLLVPMHAQLFWNRNTDEGFFDVSAASGAFFDTTYVGRGAAFGDYDNDGDVDVFVVNHNGPGVLLRNEGGNRRHWLGVALRRTQHRPTVGTRLRLVAGGRVQVRHIGAQASYCSQNSLVEHFGFGAAPVVDTLEVTWPDGHRQVLANVAANQTVRVVEGGNGP